MSRVAVLGGGAGALAAAVDLTQRGCSVALWARSDATLAPLRAIGGIGHEGLLGDGVAVPDLLSADLAAVLDGAEAAVVCLPAPGLDDLAGRLVALRAMVPLVLNPGGTGGALLVEHAYRTAGLRAPAVAELSTLTYTARKHRPDRVTVSALVQRVRAAALPGGDAALAVAARLYPRAEVVADVLATSLANLNLVVHPPGSVLALAWVEATAGDFGFYVDAVTPGVGRVVAALDAERRAVAAALGHDLPPVLEELERVGLIGPEAAAGGLAAALGDDRSPTAALAAPDGLAHRYYADDIGYALAAFVEMAGAAGTATPVARSLLTLAAAAAPDEPDGAARDRLGVAGATIDQLLARVRG